LSQRFKSKNFELKVWNIFQNRIWSLIRNWNQWFWEFGSNISNLNQGLFNQNSKEGFELENKV
jgi:hypothetical protein